MQEDQYFTLLNNKHEYHITGQAKQLDELAYFALYAMGDMNKLCGNYEKALDCGMRAEEFAPPRNEHIVLQAECYRDLQDYDSMKMQTDRLMDPDRKLPFPEFNFLLNMEHYNDSGKYCNQLNDFVLEKITK